VHVHGTWARIEEYKVFFDLTDTADGRLKDFLDVDALLGMDHLVIALLQLTIDLDVLYIQACQMLEHLIWSPGLDILKRVNHQEATSTPASFLSEGKFSILT